MIRATGTCHSDKRPIIVLGLSAKNIEILMEKKPIFFDAAEYDLGFDGHILITYGSTEDEIEAELLASEIGSE